jgi:hypothetical protein
MSERLPFIVLFPVIILDIVAIVDLVGRRDMKIGKKLLWGAIVLLAPAFGALIYLLVRYKIFQTVTKSM